MTQIELTKRLTFLESEAARHQKSIDTLEKVSLYVGDEIGVTIHMNHDKRDDPTHSFKVGGLIYLIKQEKINVENEIKKTLSEYSSKLNK